jgi:hypothetical protein
MTFSLLFFSGRIIHGRMAYAADDSVHISAGWQYVTYDPSLNPNGTTSKTVYTDQAYVIGYSGPADATLTVPAALDGKPVVALEPAGGFTGDAGYAYLVCYLTNFAWNFTSLGNAQGAGLSLDLRACAKTLRCVELSEMGQNPEWNGGSGVTWWPDRPAGSSTPFTISSINAQGCSALTYLDVADLGLTSLSLDGCSQLRSCDLQYNHLKNLNLSGCPLVRNQVNFQHNDLTEVKTLAQSYGYVNVMPQNEGIKTDLAGLKVPTKSCFSFTKSAVYSPTKKNSMTIKTKVSGIGKVTKIGYQQLDDDSGDVETKPYNGAGEYYLYVQLAMGTKYAGVGLAYHDPNGSVDDDGSVAVLGAGDTDGLLRLGTYTLKPHVLSGFKVAKKNNALKLSWKKTYTGSKNCGYYHIAYRLAGSSHWHYKNYSHSGKTSYTLKSLKNKRTYYVKVECRKSIWTPKSNHTIIKSTYTSTKKVKTK